MTPFQPWHRGVLLAILFPLHSVLAQTQFATLPYFSRPAEANAITRDGLKAAGYSYSGTSGAGNAGCWWTSAGITPIPGQVNWYVHPLPDRSGLALSGSWRDEHSNAGPGGELEFGHRNRATVHRDSRCDGWRQQLLSPAGSGAPLIGRVISSRSACRPAGVRSAARCR
jgi:hypothetical protein